MSHGSRYVKLAYAGSVYFLSFCVLGYGVLLRIGVSLFVGSIVSYLCRSMVLLCSWFCFAFPFIAAFVVCRMSSCSQKTCDFGL